MKILPVSFNTYNRPVRQNEFQNIHGRKNIFVQKPDVVSFSGSAPNAEALRALYY